MFTLISLGHLRVRSIGRRRTRSNSESRVKRNHSQSSNGDDPAVLRGEPIIPAVLSSEDFEKRLKDEISIVSKTSPNRIYRLKWNEPIIVSEKGKTVGYLCVRPRSVLNFDSPISVETYLAFYLNLTLNEESFLRVANLQRTQELRPHYSQYHW